MWIKACRRGTFAFWLFLGMVPPAIVYEAQAVADDKKIDAATARELFNEAIALQAAGDYASALQKLQQVATFKNTPQVRFNVAVCQEKVGHLVVALGEYRLAAADAAQDPKAQGVVDAAHKAIAALEPKIPTLTITVAGGVGASRISVDGNSIADAMIGKPIPMDPGRRVIEADGDAGTFRKKLFWSSLDALLLKSCSLVGHRLPPALLALQLHLRNHLRCLRHQFQPKRAVIDPLRLHG